MNTYFIVAISYKCMWFIASIILWDHKGMKLIINNAVLLTYIHIHCDVYLGLVECIEYYRDRSDGYH